MYGCAARKEVIRGDTALSAGKLEDAVIFYDKAAKLDPDNLKIKGKLEDTKIKLSLSYLEKGVIKEREGNLNQAIEFYKAAIKFQPDNQTAIKALNDAAEKKSVEQNLDLANKHINARNYSAALEKLDKLLQILPDDKTANELKAAVIKKMQERDASAGLSLSSSQPITLRFNKAKLTEVITALSKASGINIILDTEIKDSPVTIFIKDASFKEALNLLLATNRLFMKKVNDNTIIIAPNTKQKLSDYEEQKIRTFHLNYLPVKEAVNMLRTILEIRKIYIHNETNTIVVRDTPEKILLAEKMIEATDRQFSEVMLDLEILEINENDSEKYGWNFSTNSIGINIKDPDQASATAGAGISLSSLRADPFDVTVGDTVKTLKRSLDEKIFISVPGVIIDFLKQAAKAETLAHPKIRVLNGEKAEIKVGDKVPIKLSSTTSQSGTSTVGVTSQSTIEYRDVGITLTVTPTVHFNNEVTLKLKVVVTSLGEKVSLGDDSEVFRFGDRNIETSLNVADSETVILGGLIREDTRNGKSTIPFLGDIPLLGWLFSNKDKAVSKTDILVTITPHIIRNFELPAKDIQEFWSGTEGVYDVKPMFGNSIPYTGVIITDILEPETHSGKEEPGFFSNEEPPVTIQPSPIPQSPLPLIPESIIPPLITPQPQSSIPEEKMEHHNTIVSITSPGLAAKDAVISLDVDIKGAENLSDSLITIKFDQEALAFEQAIEGELLKQGEWPTAFISSGNPDTGRVSVRTYRIKDNQGVKGNGKLFSLRFKTLKPGETFINIERADLFDPSKKFIQAETKDNSITISQ